MESTLTAHCGTRRGYHEHLATGTTTCPPCRAAQARALTQWRLDVLRRGPMLVDVTGTRRRLRALACAGWTQVSIAEQLSVNPRSVGRWSVGSERVHRDTAVRVAELYAHLDGVPGPSRISAAAATTAGWAPAIAWDDDTIDDPATQPYAGQPVDVDEVAVQRALAGRPVDLSRSDRVEVARRLTAAGRSAAEISTVLGVEPRTVQRWRAAA